jgi:hypothetical protein
MSGHTAVFGLPPRDRDDAPMLALSPEPLPPAPDENAFAFEPSRRDEPVMPAAAPIDSNEAMRVARLSRFLAEAQRELVTALLRVAENDKDGFRGAMRRCSQLLKDAAPLSRLLADPPTTRATTKE